MSSAAFIAYLSLSLLCALINIVPAISHFIQGHSGPASFGIWVVIMNFLGFINGIIWIDDAHDKAPVFCDVSSKLTLVGPLGLLIANYCIIRYLARIVTPSIVVENYSKTRARILGDYALSFGIPAFIAALSVIFQVARYEVEILVGCSSVSVLAWPTVIIFIIWSPIMCGIACGYALYVLYWLIRQHKELSHLVAKSRTPLNKSRFIRMCALATTYLCISAPYTIAGTVTILGDIGPYVPWKSWAYIHDIDNQLADVRNNPTYQLNIRDWLSITAGLTVFIFFSFAHESIAVYVKIARYLHLGSLIPSPPMGGMPKSKPSKVSLSSTNASKTLSECISEGQSLTPKPDAAVKLFDHEKFVSQVYLDSALHSKIMQISVEQRTNPDVLGV